VWKYGDVPHINNFGLGDKGRYRTNVWNYAGVNTFKRERMDELTWHPTVKPVALVADAIRDVSNRGDIVLDTFGGSGTTLIAAEKTGRVARLMELDPAYCQVTIMRWQKMTGKKAMLGNSWKTFEQVAQERFSQTSAAELAS
jgi:DNA modification methylase